MPGLTANRLWRKLLRAIRPPTTHRHDGYVTVTESAAEGVSVGDLLSVTSRHYDGGSTTHNFIVSDIAKAIDGAGVTLWLDIDSDYETVYKAGSPADPDAITLTFT